MSDLVTTQEATQLLLTKAAPFLLTRLLEVGSDFGAMVMLAHLGEPELAASGLIASIQAFLRGVFATNLYSVGILSGGCFGEGNLAKKSGDMIQANLKYQEIGQYYRAGLKLAFFSSVLPILISVFMSPILQLGQQSKSTADLAQQYFRAYSGAFLANFIFVVNQQITQATGRPWDVVGFTALNRLVTLGLAAVLIYPLQMGVAGLGYAYVAGSILSTAAFTLYLQCRSIFLDYCLFQKSKLPAPNPLSHFKKLLQAGLPIAGYAIAELGSIVFLTLLLGSLSQPFLKMAQPSLQYTSFLANLIFAFGQGAGILLSQLYGEKQPLKAAQIGDLSIQLGLLLPTAFLALSISIPNLLNSVFINLKDKALFPEAKWFLIAGFITQLFDAVSNMATGTNRGLVKSIGPIMSRAPMYQRLLGIIGINIPISLGLTYGSSLEGKGAFIGRAAAIAFSSALILDTWWKTKKQTITNKLTLAQVFCPRIFKTGQLSNLDPAVHEPCLA